MPKLNVSVVGYECINTEISKLLCLLNHPAHSKGTYASILSCFIIYSESFSIFLNQNLRFTVFDLKGIFVSDLMGILFKSNGK